MRAIIEENHGGPEVLRVSEIPAPVPRSREVLIRVRAAGINRADATRKMTANSLARMLLTNSYYPQTSPRMTLRMVLRMSPQIKRPVREWRASPYSLASSVHCLSS